MPNTGVWDAYNGYLADKRKAGATLEEIGKEVGISRERVRQILVCHYGTTKMTLLLTPRQLGQLIHLGTNTIARYRRDGTIRPVNNNPRWPLYGANAIAAILAYRRCRICDKPLPVGKLSYCSTECYEIGHYEARKRCSWRRLHRRTEQPITSSIAYEKKGYG